MVVVKGCLSLHVSLPPNENNYSATDPQLPTLGLHLFKPIFNHHPSSCLMLAVNSSQQALRFWLLSDPPSKWLKGRNSLLAEFCGVSMELKVEQRFTFPSVESVCFLAHFIISVSCQFMSERFLITCEQKLLVGRNKFQANLESLSARTSADFLLHL